MVRRETHVAGAPPSHRRVEVEALGHRGGSTAQTREERGGGDVQPAVLRDARGAPRGERAALRPGGALMYETFMVGNERFGRPRNPEFLLRDGELRAFAAEHDLEERSFSQGPVGDPPSAVRQRLLARRRPVT